MLATRHVYVPCHSSGMCQDSVQHATATEGWSLRKGGRQLKQHTGNKQCCVKVQSDMQAQRGNRQRLSSVDVADQTCLTVHLPCKKVVQCCLMQHSIACQSCRDRVAALIQGSKTAHQTAFRYRRLSTGYLTRHTPNNVRSPSSMLSRLNKLPSYQGHKAAGAQIKSKMLP